MTNYDTTILLKNIKNKLEEKNITQTTLGNAIGIKQGRISKVLSENNSDCFTLSQVIDIANFFECSVDSLLFGDSNKSKEKMSITDICYCLAYLLKEKDFNFKCRNITVSECLDFDTCNGYPNIDEVTYNAFYFSEEILENANNHAHIINKFISRLLKIIKLEEHGDLIEDMYGRLLDSYIQDVEIECKKNSQDFIPFF